MRALLLLPFAALFPGCSDECQPPSDLLSGSIEATIDGQAWSTAAATWSETGSSLNVNVDRTDGYTISMVVQSAIDSRNVLDLLDQDDLPIEITLGEGEDGGWAVVYVEGQSTSYSTTVGAGGSMSIVEQEGDQLAGCVSFGASTNDGDELQLTDGFFRLVPWE